MSLKRFFAIALALAALVGVIGCQKTPGDTPVDVTGPDTVATPLPSGPFAGNEFHNDGFLGMVAAGDMHTVGLRTDGTVIAVGHDLYGQCRVNKWSGIVNIAASTKFTAGATDSGRVLIAGELDPDAEGVSNAEALTAIAAWTDIVAVAAGAGHVVGLKSDGTVVAAGNDAVFQCDVSAWSDIVAIAAGGNTTVGLTKDGTVVATGDDTFGQCSGVTAWKEAIAIAAGSGHVAALLSSGGVVSTAGGTEAWTGIVKVFAGGNTTVGLTADGSIVAAPDDMGAAAVASLYYAAPSGTHIALMQASGALKAVGSNDDLQCDTDGYSLRLVDTDKDADGLSYFKGFRIGSPLAACAEILAAQYGDANVEFKKADAALPESDPVATGVDVYIAGAREGTIVLMGDVNGDGAINEADAEAIEKHISGSEALTGAAERAARIYLDLNSKVTAASATAVRSFASGNITIAQYARHYLGVYDKEIADTRAKNADCVGWVKVPGTNIDYPIMYDSTGKWYYNYHTVDKKEADAGSIYAYYNSFTYNNVVTGHNSRPSQRMFHYMHHIQEYNEGKTNCAYKDCNAKLTDELPDLSVYAERVWTLTIYGIEGKWELFSIYETKPGVDLGETLYDNVWWPGKDKNNYMKETTAKVQAWIDKQVELSEVKIDCNLSTDDTFLTLFTCGNEKADADRNARLFLFFKLVG